MYLEKSDCERVSPAMLLAGGSKCREMDGILVDFDLGLSGAPVGVPWINKGEHDGSSRPEVVKKVQRSFGRVTKSVATTADGTLVLLLLGWLRDCGGLGGREGHLRRFKAGESFETGRAR
jgi:hypothetical protein